MTPKRRTALLVGIAALLLLAVGVRTALIFAGRSGSLPTLEEAEAADSFAVEPSDTDPFNTDPFAPDLSPPDATNPEPSDAEPNYRDASLEGIMERARSYQADGDYDQALHLLTPLRDRHPQNPQLNALWQELLRQQQQAKRLPPKQTTQPKQPKQQQENPSDPPASGTAANKSSANTKPDSRGEVNPSPKNATKDKHSDTSRGEATASRDNPKSALETVKPTTLPGAAEFEGAKLAQEGTKPEQAALDAAKTAQAAANNPPADPTSSTSTSSKSAADYADAAARLDNPTDQAELLYQSAILLYQQQQYSQAEEGFKQVAQLKPQYPRVYYALALSQLQQKKLAPARNNLEQQLKLDKQHSASLWQLAQLLPAEQSNRSEQLLKQAIALKADDPRYYRSLGQLYFREGNFQQAFTYFQQALRYQSTAADAYSAGVSLLSMQQYLQAIDFFNRALAQQPDEPDYLLSCAQALALAGQSQQAEEKLLSLLKIQPDHPEAHAALGRIYLEQKRLDQAEAQLRRAWQLKPQQLSSGNDLGLLLQRQNQPQQAIEIFTQTLKSYPNSALLHFNLANSLLSLNQLKDTREAITHLRRSLQLDQHNEDAWVALVLASLAANAPSTARAAFAELKALYPQNSQLDQLQQKLG